MVRLEGLYSIEHSSVYEYSTQRTACIMQLCLKPRSIRQQYLEAFDLVVEPLTHALEFEDFLGNSCHLINIHRPHKTVSIRSKSLVSVQSQKPLTTISNLQAANAFDMGGYAEVWDYEHPSELTPWSAELNSFLEVNNIVKTSDLLESLRNLETTIHETLRYVPESTTVDTPIVQMLERGEGVCQDFAHMMLAVARHWGVPTRYAMGYLCPTEHNETKTQESHAWVECLLPESGWVSFDPTNPSLQGNGYITVAYGRDFKDVSPTRGLNMGGGDEELQVEVKIKLL